MDFDRPLGSAAQDGEARAEAAYRIGGVGRVRGMAGGALPLRALADGDRRGSSGLPRQNDRARTADPARQPISGGHDAARWRQVVP